MRTPVARLFALLLIMVGLVAVPASPAVAHHRGAEVVAVEQVADRQVDLTVRSDALGGREVKVRLLTPDGWDPDNPRQHWPTLWLLHGCCGDYTSWTELTDVAETPELRDTLVVMPEAGWNGWYSNWWGNGGDNDQQWETFHLRELRPLLEHEFGAGPKRVVAGLSMGGQGSLMYAARYPGMFRAAASFSGSVHPLDSDESIKRLQGFFAHEGNDPDNVWGDPVDQRKVWEQHDPYFLAERLADIPVYLSCGNGEAGPYDTPGTTNALEADFGRQNEALAAGLESLGADVTTNFYGPGQHKWAYWERELHASLPMLLGALD
ncbi:alpha/beta hydrolase-fold protein [Propionibacteriaceae bacterium Y1700]|uniref:alpha/beta hydrolase-fold protein n=1 Tax=Microlunatus sp. Y1700 TaxID=3418487 RepID=UPI003DA76F9F